MLRPQPCLPRRLFAVLASFVLGGCGWLGGQTGQDTAGGLPFSCHDRKTPVATSGASTIGVSADDLLASLPPLGGTLHLFRPDQVDNLTLSLSSASAAREVVETEEAVSFGDGTMCRNKLEVDAVATLLTDDGLFNASLPVTLEAEASSSWRLQGERKLSEIGGTYDWSVFPLDQWQDPSLQVQAQTNGGGPGATITGALSLVGSDPNPADGATPVAAAVGNWMSAGPGGGGGGTGAVGGAGEFGGTGGGNGSLGGAGGTVGGVNSTGGTSGSGGTGGAGGSGGG